MINKDLKEKYNESLKATRNAEDYFKSHDVNTCLKYLNLFNERTKEISLIMKEIRLKGYIMTKKEIEKGFNI